MRLGLGNQGGDLRLLGAVRIGYPDKYLAEYRNSEKNNGDNDRKYARLGKRRK